MRYDPKQSKKLIQLKKRSINKLQNKQTHKIFEFVQQRGKLIKFQILIRNEMGDHEYINKSINSLVEELNTLGNRSVLIQKTQLMGVQRGESRNIRRFQSKAIPRRQFYKLNETDKKYFYDTVTTDLTSSTLNQFMINWQKGYNTTITIQNNNEHLIQLVKITSNWTKDCLMFCVALNEHNQLFDLLGQMGLTHREMLENKKYYEIDDLKRVDVLTTYLQAYFNHQNYQLDKTLIDITFKNPTTGCQLHLTTLPKEIFHPDCSPPYSLIKTQLTQLLNYIKINPNKRYQHISKLITKRLPMTNYLTKIFMGDSSNLIINFIQQNHYQKDSSIGKFQLFDKFSIVSNLLTKTDLSTIQIATRKPLPTKLSISHNNNNQDILALTRARNSKYNKQSSAIDQLVSPIGRLNLKTEYTQERDILVKQRQIEQKQFEFCRSLERKTHKYSISPRQQPTSNQSKEPLQMSNNNQTSNTIKDKKTLTRYHSIQALNQFDNIQINQKQDRLGAQTIPSFPAPKQTVSESQQITLLKAQHAREISQYHQTIQLLNKKIMILTKDLNLEELYKIHQRQIMLLEFKIKELREDISILTKENSNGDELKSIVNKLTQELKNHEQTSISKKLSQGKLFMVQKQLLETKQKLSTSEKARSLLNLQVQTLTKRLKIRDSEISKINHQDKQKYQCEELSVTEEQLLEEIKKLVMAVKNQQRNSTEYLLRKISFILSDLSKSRDIILQCNDFLVQLMQVLDHKMSKKEPQIVLNCNKFIRGFLMSNLAIF